MCDGTKKHPACQMETNGACADETPLEFFVDLFCGVGGFAAGARAFCKPVLGVDNDDQMVRLWAANTKSRGQLANLWGDAVKFPGGNSRGEGVHVHMSPPCTTLSRARVSTAEAAAHGISYLRQSLEFILERNHTSWSVETVSTPSVQECLRRFRAEHALFEFGWTVVDAADYGCPSTRVRIIVGNLRLIHNLREIPVTRVSVADAFRSSGLTVPPADYIKNNTRTRANKPCLRHVSQSSHTQTASHPLMWCTKSGETVRCLNVQETALIMGFPSDWMLPKTSRAAIKAIGNAVPPPLAAAIMYAARHDETYRYYP